MELQKNRGSKRKKLAVCENSGTETSFKDFPLEIREQIFRYLEVRDLLNCRLVDQQWKTQASSVLRQWKQCFAIVRQPCRNLLRLDAAVRRFNFNLINGLKVLACSSSCIHAEVGGRHLDCLFSGQLENTPFKYISVALDGDGFGGRMCPAATVVKKIIWMSRQSLERLWLGSSQSWRLVEDFADISNGEEVLFPNMFSFSLADCEWKYTLTESMQQFLMHAAPKLKEISSCFAYKWNWGPYNEDACSKISSFTIDADMEDTADDGGYHLEKFVSGSPRKIKRLWMDFCRTIWQDPMQSLLESSKSSLKTMTICVGVLLPAMATSSSCCSFPNVEYLGILMPQHTITSGWLYTDLLRSIDIGRAFPALKRSAIGWCLPGCSGDDDELDPTLETLSAYRVATGIPSRAEEIEVAYADQRIHFEYFEQLFPHVTKLTYYTKETDEFDIACVFVLFPKLKSLTMIMQSTEADSAFLDALLCGISEQEVKLLQHLHKNGWVSLEELALAPIGPSLSNLTRLKEFKLTVAAKGLISEISGILAFSRLRNVNIRVEGPLDSWKDMDQLIPYVAQVSVEGLGDYKCSFGVGTVM